MLDRSKKSISKKVRTNSLVVKPQNGRATLHKKKASHSFDDTIYEQEGPKVSLTEQEKALFSSISPEVK